MHTHPSPLLRNGLILIEYAQFAETEGEGVCISLLGTVPIGFVVNINGSVYSRKYEPVELLDLSAWV